MSMETSSGSLNFLRRHIILTLMTMSFGSLVVGFGLGVYFLPIIIADAPADASIVQAASASAERQAMFVRDRKDSDATHYGNGTLFLSSNRVTLEGTVTPGPDYRLYLTPKYVETGDDFRAIKAQSVEIARVKGFENFSYEISQNIDINAYSGVVIWCEKFGKYITSGPLETRAN
ncbi:MAG: DM13 domain-containing protein [Candidatus Puniceispirillales bacterium WSBS_2018_MAG_OTU23]